MVNNQLRFEVACCLHLRGRRVGGSQVVMYQLRLHYVAEGLNLHQHHCENLKRLMEAIYYVSLKKMCFSLLRG
jgi:hypothetical protein